MNEIKKCSISGVAFTLDKEAYETLENYLNGLHEAYRHSADGPEIVADIEARIAELILSVQDGGQVVEKPLILNIIDQLGHIEELSGEQQENGGAREDDDLQPADRIPRRLYRDPENAKLGGVCAGLGKYFDIDPVWIRLGLFVPLILMIFSSGTFSFLSALFGNLTGACLLCYLVLWFAIPSARSARQKLEMEGSPVTVRNVAQTAMAANETDSKAKPIIAETVSVFGKVVLILLKLFAGFVVLGLIITACAFIIGLISILIGGPEMLGIPIWLPVLAILMVLIPNLLLIYVLMCLIASRKPGGRTIWTSLVLWVLTIIACLITAFRTLPDKEEWYKLSDLNQWSLNFQGSVNGGIHVIKEPQPDMEDLQRQLQAGEPVPGTDSTVRTPAAPAEPDQPTAPAQPAEPAAPSTPAEPAEP